MTRLHANGQRDINRSRATAAGRNIRRADEGLALAITERVALSIGKKFYAEICVRRTVEAALNGCATSAAVGRGEDRIILQVVWTGVAIAIVVGLDAVRVAIVLQVDPEPGIRENGVAQDCVVNGR